MLVDNLNSVDTLLLSSVSSHRPLPKGFGTRLDLSSQGTTRLFSPLIVTPRLREPRYHPHPLHRPAEEPPNK